MVAVTKVRAIPGQGLEGDRYFYQAGTLSDRSGFGSEVTLVELEVLEALRNYHGIALDPQATRRNIISRGIRLNTLVGREFRVGEVILRGAKLCEPCAHLEQATRKGVLRALAHRGGLRAQILVGGTISVGDFIEDQAGLRSQQGAVSHEASSA
ncbi:MAG TPA: MOSC domain-containing protein [Candidatus Acidoferrales bacterium]|nr:MOSC domain-containing protein [Candidatus Acidoferrales bacterium]